MPGIDCHIFFADITYRNLLRSNIELDKIKFMSGNIIPDLSTEDKIMTHYRVNSSIKGLFVPDMARVEKEFLVVEDSLKVGMFAHFYLDYYFIEEFFIPQFIWDYSRMKIINPRNGREWDPKTFFNKEGVYYKGFYEINKYLIKYGYLNEDIIEKIPEKLPKTGLSMFDSRREKSWKEELEENIIQGKNKIYDVFDCEQLVKFIKKISLRLTEEIANIK